MAHIALVDVRPLLLEDVQIGVQVPGPAIVVTGVHRHGGAGRGLGTRTGSQHLLFGSLKEYVRGRSAEAGLDKAGSYPGVLNFFGELAYHIVG